MLPYENYHSKALMLISMDANNLTLQIKKSALESGAELVGFAPVEPFEKNSKPGHAPSDLLSNPKSIIVLACGRKLNEDRTYFYKWGPDYSLTYIKLKDELKENRKKARKSIDVVKKILTDNGFNAITEPHGWSGILSFKQAAYFSGLGVFGKGTFVVHPDLGHVNILACILTDAPLVYGTPLALDVCGECTECIKACKYGAFNKINGSFEWVAEKCRCYDLIKNPITLKWTYGPCNSKCVNVCPIGK